MTIEEELLAMIEPPSVRGSATSAAAAASVAGVTGPLRVQCYTVIHDAGRDGLTRDEVEVATGLKHQTATARVRELVKMGAVRETQRTRLTRSNRSAVVCIAAPFET